MISGCCLDSRHAFFLGCFGQVLVWWWFYVQLPRVLEGGPIKLCCQAGRAGYQPQCLYHAVTRFVLHNFSQLLCWVGFQIKLFCIQLPSLTVDADSPKECGWGVTCTWKSPLEGMDCYYDSMAIWGEGSAMIIWAIFGHINSVAKLQAYIFSTAIEKCWQRQMNWLWGDFCIGANVNWVFFIPITFILMCKGYLERVLEGESPSWRLFWRSVENHRRICLFSFQLSDL